jgi:uncharacterized protein
MTNQNQPQPPQVSNEIERRYADAPEIETRADAPAGSRRISGYALKFNQAYDMGPFTEEIRSGALNGAAMDDVLALFNHDMNIILARTSSRTLELRIDDIGVHYSFEAPKSPNGDNILESIRRGDVRQSSWSWLGAKSDWETRNGKQHRSITSVAHVVDVSPVTYPANPDTSVALRSRPHAQAPAVNNAAVEAQVRIRALMADTAL